MRECGFRIPAFLRYTFYTKGRNEVGKCIARIVENIMKEKARFCRFCGARLEENTGEQFTQQGTVSQEPEEQNAQDYQNMQAGQEQQSNGYEDNGPVKKKGKKIWNYTGGCSDNCRRCSCVVFFVDSASAREKRTIKHIYRMVTGIWKKWITKKAEGQLPCRHRNRTERTGAVPETWLIFTRAQNEPEKVVEILKQGTENTDSPEIQEKYDLYTYVQDVLIPEEGQVKEGEYTCEYINQTMGSSVWDQYRSGTFRKGDSDIANQRF